MDTRKLIEIATVQKTNTSTDLKFNLKYSLRLIEASIEYLAMTDKAENMNEYPFATTSLEEVLSKSYLDCDSTAHTYSKEMLKELLKDHERIIIQLQKRVEYGMANCNNPGIMDFITFILEEHRVMAAKFRKFLRAGN